MQTYKFDTHIDNNGVIILPENLNLKDLDVNVIISINNNEKNEYTIDDFVNEWKGVLSGIDPDKAKYDYLMEKHK